MTQDVREDGYNQNLPQEEQLDTAAATTDDGLITYMARALGAIAQDEVRVDFQKQGGGTLTVEIEVTDDAGNTAIAQGEELGTALGGTETALITYLAQALAGVGNDQLRVDLQNDNLTSNLDIDVAEQSLAQLTATLEADDDAGNTAEVQAEELGTAVGGTETALITKIAEALSTVGNATLRVSAPSNLPVEQQSPVGIENGTGTQKDVLGTGDEPLNVSAATVTVTDNGGFNASVEVDHGEAFENGTSVSSNGSTSKSLSQPGADSLSGVVTRSNTSYDVDVEWQNSSGTVIQTESVASGVAAGSQTTFDLPARSPYCNVVVSDAGSGSGAVDATYHLR